VAHRHHQYESAERKFAHVIGHRFDGVDAAQSGSIDDNEESWLETTVTGPGWLGFWWQTSCEPGYDFLQFSVDGVEQAANWGEIDWQQIIHFIPSGSHIARWAYIKDESVSEGSDAGWLDGVAFSRDNAPVINSQPLNQTTATGNSVEYSVSAVGLPPLLYQWRLNGIEILGATNSILALTNLQYSFGSTYSAVVRNAFGSATSRDTALIWIEQPPFLVSQPVDYAGFLYGPATLETKADGIRPFSYQWRFNGVDLAGATDAILRLERLSYASTGRYSVRVSNQFGSVASSEAVVS
jgi:hypothetical protein